MGIRAFWIITPSQSTSNEEQLIYTRRFSVMEKHASQVLGELYVPIPRDNRIISKSIVCQVGLERKTADIFMEKRDSCTITPQMPIIEVQLDENTKLWPIVIVEHCGHLLCCLPLIDKTNYNSDSIGSLIQLHSISTALSVLLSIQTFFGQMTTLLQKSSPILEQLDKYLSIALPFGRPGELDPTLIQSMLTIKPVFTDTKQSIMPLPTKSQNITIKVTEFIRGVQYDNPEIKNVIQVYGSINWSGCLEKQQTEVILNLSSIYGSMDILPLNFVTLHPCVFQIDQDVPTMSRKFRFKPLLSSFPLCYYVVQAKKFPITGSFKMQYFNNYLEFSLHLNLDEKVRNVFEVCEVLIPIAQRSIASYDLKPSWGEIAPSKDGKFIIWTLGQQFPYTFQVSATGTVNLTTQITEFDLKKYSFEAFAQVHFRIPEFTLSGYFVDTKSVQTTIPSSAKMSSKREFCSVEYKIWNKISAPPIHFNQKLVSEPQTPV